MTREIFFKIYLNAIELALRSEKNNENLDHYDFIDKDVLKDIEIFESENIGRLGTFFEHVKGYFNARDHNILFDGKQTLAEYRDKLIDKINGYKILYRL